jgi:cytochrome c oxidase assembly protein subunit 15
MPAEFETPSDDPHRAVRRWLWCIVWLVAMVAVVGAATRLTDSGLSITEWQPIMGAIPPLGEADWKIAFDKYRQIPEYKLVNKGMTLEAFKVIFWWEWAHRFLARAVGVAYLLPLVFFAVTGRIPAGYRMLLVGLFVLGGLQGLLGWYMVQSGLADRIDVSQYRLAAHLGLAFVIMGGAASVALALTPVPGGGAVLATTTRADRRLASLLLAAIFLQVLSGALVAGSKAGLSHNTWPLMDGALVPAGLLAMQPWYLNFFENVATVQFQHRLLAYAIAGLALWHAVSVVRRTDEARLERSAVLLALAVVAQIALGVWTLLAHVPVSLGVAHQAMGIVVFLVAVRHQAVMRRAP